MCQSSVWACYPNGQIEKIADDVRYVNQEGNEVLLRWFLKEPLRVAGRIVAVDAVKHTITLEVSGSPTGKEEFEAVEEPIKAASEHAYLHPHSHLH